MASKVSEVWRRSDPDVGGEGIEDLVDQEGRYTGDNATP